MGGICRTIQVEMEIKALVWACFLLIFTSNHLAAITSDIFSPQHSHVVENAPPNVDDEYV